MRTLTLSDHTADKVAAAAADREAEYVADMGEYRDALAARESRVTFHRNALRTAWSKGRPFSLFAAVVRLVLASWSKKPRPPVLREADREEIVWASGNEGERLVAEHLSRLSDEWVLVSGYRNAKGEIDQILIGPHGVFSIEIKFINGTVHCDADRWWSDKYDRYGNLVEQDKPLADKRGRGPSRQLNESADSLQTFLAKRANVSRVFRVVVLSHHSSELGEMRNVTVDMVATRDSLDLDRLFSISTTRLDAKAVEQVLQAIRKDHAYHARPRRDRARIQQRA